MDTSIISAGVFALFGLGMVFGLKHAIEVDHLVAVSAIVSEHRSVFRAALVGGLWGAGHTVSLVIVGAIVLVFRVAIPAAVAGWLEFGVALMIITLGVIALLRLLRRRAAVHLHRHSHENKWHAHIHFHDEEGQNTVSTMTHSHAISRIGFKPILVGAMHGLAGSAALTLLVLTQIQSMSLGLLYLAVFGVGSTLGMLVMSGLIGLPFALRVHRISRLNLGLQTAAGVLSIVFGVWYAWKIVLIS